MYSFKNKNVLITGGASGIGYIMGKKVLERGAAALIIWDIDNAQLKVCTNRLLDADHIIRTRKVDITEESEVKSAVAELKDLNLSVDVLINNAGIVNGGRFIEQNTDDIRKTLNVNSWGMMLMTRYLLPQMIARRSGYIVNIASAAGLTPNPGMAVYASSKWAVVGWSESLRLELEQDHKNIRVLTVMPGYIDTGMFKGVRSPKLIPLLKPHEISEKILSSVEKGKARLREPFMVKLTPFFKGVLPSGVYDLIAGKILRVYSSMESFKGRDK